VKTDGAHGADNREHKGLALFAQVCARISRRDHSVGQPFAAPTITPFVKFRWTKIDDKRRQYRDDDNRQLDRERGG